MNGNVIDFLNAPADISKLFLAVVVWFALWHLILKRILRKCKVTSIWYELYELGAFGTLGLILFLAIIMILFIGSIQAVVEIGAKLLFPLFIFWGIMITVAILIIRNIRK